MASCLLMPECCRCCLASESEMFDVFEQMDEFESKISDVIANCGGITITETDYFSKSICSNCLTDLAHAARFRLRCMKTEDVLQTTRLDVKNSVLHRKYLQSTSSTESIDQWSAESYSSAVKAEFSDIETANGVKANEAEDSSSHPTTANFASSFSSVSGACQSQHHVGRTQIPNSTSNNSHPIDVHSFFQVNKHYYERDHLRSIISDKLDAVKTEITSTVLSVMDALLYKAVAALRSDCHREISPVPPDQAIVNLPGELILGKNEEFKPIKTAKELECLEQNLNDPVFAQRLFSHMREKIGNKGDNYRGQNTCYYLIDRFFDRKFLIHCSWSGGSRSDIEKSAIKDCKNILALFYRIVRSTNEKFSFHLLENFFKSVVKNAKKRSEAKGLRVSTIHRRKKKSSKSAGSISLSTNAAGLDKDVVASVQGLLEKADTGKRLKLDISDANMRQNIIISDALLE
ncbi:uncharacterized protein LOC131685443 isoform X2 [Topomyia yanbarensis]|uniref:uncharacterized protein LOC131685443 isoform X2 n=1 Tax=Topomyia yanbarensis TaxID=2498891 RepID=UPI00273C049A|nr:uncharacterized protein LOC131685443 isoform X2 [Topomyia yanbarensis]